ncbi:hypothetical protein [Streptosporangium pseudovulgare]|uniref:Uncharacterized protein n=1 Tax=Streptosporangium pseudovulgare TaxID=35765 RepID=A0ABQ2RAC7_9ACTN|nr:hypothetical protein [Streptosporangium pseudovulgare]GGQ15802.1 hypothetical protein GCM10010140_52620 [Streptosporangium pseudovulgare]
MRTAISAGALVLALTGALPLASAAPAGAAAWPAQPGCERRGPLGGVTGGLCDTLGAVGDTLGTVGDTVGKAVDGVGKTVDGVVDRAAETVDTGRFGVAAETTTGTGDSRLGVEADVGVTTGIRTGAGAETSGSTSRSAGPGEDPSTPGDGAAGPATAAPRDSTGACAPAASSGCADPAERSVRKPPSHEARPTARPLPRPSRSGDPEQAVRRDAPSGPVRPTAVPSVHDTGSGPVTAEPSPPVADPEAPRVELLWPGAGMRELRDRMPADRPVKPTRSSDPAGTALTIVLLVVAILAVRLLYVRRGGESMPFEPLRLGRHRTASASRL